MRALSAPVATRLIRGGVVFVFTFCLSSCQPDQVIGPPLKPSFSVQGATKLAFTTLPSNTTAGQAMSPVKVTAQDDLGNTVKGFTGNVTVTIGTNPAGGTLSGTTTVAAVSGVATFSTLSINKAGTGYTLTAASTGLTGATSAPFTITPGSATQLAFTVQPTSTPTGRAISPAVRVTARDALGNTATAFTGTVTMAISTNPAGGTLSGTTAVAAVAGVATYSTLSIDKVGTGYRLSATVPGLTGVTSNAFNITLGTLVFTVQPTTTTAGAAITPAVQVTVRDPSGKTFTTFPGTVTVAISTNPAGGTLSGTTTVTPVAGVATFSDLSINKAASGYKLSATVSGFSTVTSASFVINPGPATKLAFIAQPPTTPAGALIIPAVQVAAQDALGNTVKSFAGTATVAIGANPSGGTLSGKIIVAFSSGVAAFSTLSISTAGSGYTLSATTTGLTSATSAAFTITAPATTKLVFTVPPSAATAGVAISPPVQVTAQNVATGATVTTFTGNVIVLITPGTGINGAALSGTRSVAAVGGVATFSNLSINKAGIGYKLSTTATGVAGANSGSFTVSPGAPTKVKFTVQPVTTTAGATITPAVQVSVQDALGNVVKTFTGSVSVAIGVNPGGGTLSGTTTVTPTSGVAAFSTLSINKSGTGYRLVATSTGLKPDTGLAFSITAGPATQLAFTVQPSNTAAGAAIFPAVKVSAQDALGNTAKTFTGTVTVAIGTNPAGGTLSGTTAVAAVSGVATFSTLRINTAATGYMLTATSSGLGSATSAAFNIF